MLIELCEEPDAKIILEFIESDPETAKIVIQLLESDNMTPDDAIQLFKTQAKAQKEEKLLELEEEDEKEEIDLFDNEEIIPKEAMDFFESEALMSKEELQMLESEGLPSKDPMEFFEGSSKEGKNVKEGSPGNANIKARNTLVDVNDQSTSKVSMPTLKPLAESLKQQAALLTNPATLKALTMPGTSASRLNNADEDGVDTKKKRRNNDLSGGDAIDIPSDSEELGDVSFFAILKILIKVMLKVLINNVKHLFKSCFFFSRTIYCCKKMMCLEWDSLVAKTSSP